MNTLRQGPGPVDLGCVAPPLLTELQWVALLIDASTRRCAPPLGSMCDAWPIGCGDTARHALTGPRLGLCDDHMGQLEDRADALGLVLRPSSRLFAVTYSEETGSRTIWCRRGGTWVRLTDPRRHPSGRG